MRTVVRRLVIGPGRRLLLAEFGRHRRPLVGLAGWSILEALPPLLSGQLVARALDRGFVAGRPWVGVAYLLLLGALYLVAAQATRRCYPPVATIVESLRDVLLHRVVSATLRQAVADGRPDAGAVARVTQQVETVRDVVAGLLLVLRRIAVAVSAAVIGLLLLDTAIALLVAAPLALSILAFGVLMGTLARRQRRLVIAAERVATAASPVVQSVRDVAAYGAERSVQETIGAEIDRHFRATHALGRASSFRIPIMALGAYVPVVLILVSAPTMRGNGVTVGVLLGAIVYVTTTLEPALRALVQTVGNSGLRLTIALRRLVETSTPPAPPSSPVNEMPPRGHDIHVAGVTFAYGARAEPVIRDLNLTVPAGEHLAVVGPSGIGKSTLANLLVGTERPQSGTVRIGGVPVTALGDAGAPRAIVLIPQEAYVFTGTLWENLAYLRGDPSPQEIQTVTERFALSRLAARLGGLHQELSPATLAAGERQLIALARAYLSTAPVAVLDEATCHLDPTTEAMAEEAFAARPGTLIVIAHRITSARRARRVLLMADTGVQTGTHETLLHSSALYRDLVGLWDGVPAR